MKDWYGSGNSTNIPRLLTKKENVVVKEVVWMIKFPTGFASNISNILTKKGNFGGDKINDWHTFMKVWYFESLVILLHIDYMLSINGYLYFNYM